MSQADEADSSSEALPLEVLGLVARRLRSDKRPGTERLACVCKTWSHINQHVSNIQLVINKMTNPAKAASLAAWLLRHAPCLGSLTLDASASFPPAQHHLHLQQVLPAVQQAAIAATNPAEGGGGGGPLGLMRLVLKGLIVSYPQLGTLLGSLRDLKELQLCTSSHYHARTSTADRTADRTALGQQLAGLATTLTRLQRLRLDWYLQGQDLSTVLPPGLTSLSCVLDDDMAGAGSQQLTHLVKLRQLTLLPNGASVIDPSFVLLDAAAVAALPALEEVVVEDRVLGQLALSQLSRHLMRLSHTSNLLKHSHRINHADSTALTSLTFLKTMFTGGSTLAAVLPALTALKTLQLCVDSTPQVQAHLLACKELQHLRNLELEVSDGLHSPGQLSLPTRLTSLTMLTQQLAAPWHSTLAPLKCLRVLTVHQDILTCDEDVLTALTALTKLVLATRAHTGRQHKGNLHVVALGQVQTVGAQLRQLVVEGPVPCSRLQQHLAAALPPSCRCVLKDRLPATVW